MAQWKTALAQLLLEQGLYKTIPKISLGSSNWSSPLPAIKHLFQFTLPPSVYPAFLPILCPNGRSCHSIFQNVLTVHVNAKNTKCCFSNAICMWYQHLFMNPPYMKDAFILTFKENSCLGPHKYLMYFMLSCTSLSIRSFKLFHVTIYQCRLFLTMPF